MTESRGGRYQYPRAVVQLPVHAEAEAIYMRTEEEGPATVCFIIRSDTLVPAGTSVRIPVDQLSGSAALAIQQQLQGAAGSNMSIDMPSSEFVEAVQKIGEIVKKHEARRVEEASAAAAAKLRKMR